MSEISQHIEGLTDKVGEALKSMEDLQEDLKKDGADREAIKVQLKAHADFIVAEQAKDKEAADKAEDEKFKAEFEELKKSIRTPSKAGIIGFRDGGSVSGESDPADIALWSIWAAKTTQAPQFNAVGKANLQSLGMTWADVPAESKATLGDTTGAGGYLVPNNVVTDFIEVSKVETVVRNLFNIVDAGFVAGIDIPTEGLAPTRAVVQPYGQTKENLDLTTARYTATMYTIARIYDVGNQLLRNSRGGAERLVRSSLARGFALGESYYVLRGSGTLEPKGLLTSIGTSGTFVTSHTAVGTTLAGSSAVAIAKAAKDLANRSRQPDGAIVNAGDFWTMLSQGTDTAGFWFSPTGGPGAINAAAGLSFRVWGIPVYGDTNMPTDSLVVGEFKSANVYTGQGYRVDVSDQAGTRWDKNETGFRGEEELGFNADPYVTAGLFQRVIDFVP